MLKYNDDDILQDDELMEELEKNKKLYKVYYDETQKKYIKNYNNLYNKKQ